MTQFEDNNMLNLRNKPPPQLWRLDSTPSGIRLSLERQFCARERVSALEFDPKRHVQFSGKGQFLNNDRFVLCTTTGGYIRAFIVLCGFLTHGN
jgi:hypothetical protein